MESQGPRKRGSVRFKPEKNSVAELDLAIESGDFTPQMYGLILNESYTGCSLVILKSNEVTPGIQCTVKVGDLAPMRAEVKWCTELDEGVLKIGLMYLE